MTGQHTPEPWIQGSTPYTNRGIFTHEAGHIAQCYFRFRGEEDSSAEPKANACRIVACVNACAGIPIEALESGAVAKLVSVAWAALYLVPMGQPESGQLRRVLELIKAHSVAERVRQKIQEAKP